MREDMASKYIANEVKFVQEILSQFFCDVCKIDRKKKKEMEKVFNNIYVSYSSNMKKLGEANFTGQYILINKRLKSDRKAVIACLLHEYAHMLINRKAKNYRVIPTSFSEGAADAVAELVINWYFSNHKDVTVGYENIEYDLPYRINSKYIEEDSNVKTTLYVLYKQNKLESALAELVLGDPRIFFGDLLGKEDAKSALVADKHQIKNIQIDYCDLYFKDKSIFKDLDRNDILALRNHLLLLFKLYSKYDLDMFALKHGLKDNFDCYEINHLIFKNRKFYEIDPKEYEDFIYLYDNARLNKKKIFKDNSWSKYVNLMVAQLNGEEVIENSNKILKNLTYAISTRDNKRIHSGYLSFFNYCARVEIRKIKDNNLSEEYIEKLKNDVFVSMEEKLKKFRYGVEKDKFKKMLGSYIDDLDHIVEERKKIKRQK